MNDPIKFPPLPERAWSMFCTKCGYSGPADVSRINSRDGKHFTPCAGACGYLCYAAQDPFTADQMRAHAAAVSAADNASLTAELVSNLEDVAEVVRCNPLLREEIAALRGALIRATNFELDAERLMRHEPMLNGFEDLWAIEAERETMEQRVIKACELIQEQRRTIGVLMCGMPEDGTTPVIRRIAAMTARVKVLEDALISFTKSTYIKKQHPRRYANALAALEQKP